MNKEIKDRLDKLETELKESKNEIHSLKSSVSLTIERGIRKVLSRFTRKQLILGSVIALFSISIIGIAGTVSKTYTFSSGEVVSASKFNTNFDTLFTLVNGNLDDNNISGISGSKITSGTVAAARIDNLDGSKITSGKVAAERIDNVSSMAINYDGIFLFTTYAADTADYASNPGSSTSKGGFGGRTQADNFCNNWKFKIVNRLNTCSNVRALISISGSDEVRDMPTNYSVPLDKPVFNDRGLILSENFTELISGNTLPFRLTGTHELLSHSSYTAYWTGTSSGGSLNSDNCDGWTTGTASSNGQVHRENSFYYGKTGTNLEFYACGNSNPLMCLCF